MTLGVPLCDRPGQSAAVGVVSGLAGGLALVGDLLGHLLAGELGREDAPAGAADCRPTVPSIPWVADRHLGAAAGRWTPPSARDARGANAP